MTGRRIVVIPNAVRDLDIAIPAYAALCFHPNKSLFVCHAKAISYCALQRRCPRLPAACGAERNGCLRLRDICKKRIAQILHCAQHDGDAPFCHPERSEGSVRYGYTLGYARSTISGAAAAPFCLWVNAVLQLRAMYSDSAFISSFFLERLMRSCSPPTETCSSSTAVT